MHQSRGRRAVTAPRSEGASMLPRGAGCQDAPLSAAPIWAFLPKTQQRQPCGLWVREFKDKGSREGPAVGDPAWVSTRPPTRPTGQAPVVRATGVARLPAHGQPCTSLRVGSTGTLSRLPGNLWRARAP